jgi:hypothetical protein
MHKNDQYQTPDEVVSSPEPKTLQTSERDAVVECFINIQPHSCVLEKLHVQLCQNALPEANIDVDTMIAEISRWTTLDVGRQITHCLQRQFETTNAQVTGFRANIIYSIGEEEFAWPVVEWKEGVDTEVIAIFYIDEESPSGVCSWLMHYGHGVVEDYSTNRTKRWKSATISWSVTDMDHLKSLFGAAQNLFGVLGWSTNDMIQLYGKRNLENCSEDEYVLSPLVKILLTIL